MPLSHLDMVGVVGSSPIAPTKFGREIKHLAETPSAFFLAVPNGRSSAPQPCNGYHPRAQRGGPHPARPVRCREEPARADRPSRPRRGACARSTIRVRCRDAQSQAPPEPFAHGHRQGCRTKTMLWRSWLSTNTPLLFCGKTTGRPRLLATVKAATKSVPTVESPT